MINSKEGIQLTVAIPTYNRPEQLKRTLNKLAPQLNDKCFLRILDNCSDLDVCGYAEPIILKYGITNYEIIRNKINIGGNGNIMRCFESCATDWLWTLGDDDEIVENAIEIILNDIIVYSNSVNINYYSPHKFHPVRDNTVISKGRIDFIRNVDDFGAVIFISTNVYNTRLLKLQWLANHSTYSCASQWLITYYSLDKNSVTVQSDKVVCINTFFSDEYSNVNLIVVNGFSTLLNIYTSKQEKKLLIRMLKTVTHHWLTLEGIVKTLLIEYMIAGKSLDILFCLNRIYINFYKDFGKATFIKYRVYKLAISISPTYAFKTLRYLYLKRNGIDINNYLNN